MSPIEPQPGIMDIALYEGGKSKVEGVTNVVKLSSNENPFGASLAAKDAVARSVHELHRYPSTDHASLRAAIGEVHGVDPGPYLTHVHDISFHPLEPDADLAAHISALPGRRIIYTNGTEPYARRVIEARGLSGLFDAVYGVEHAGFHPKPRREAFEAVFTLDGLDTAKAAMFEDDPRNLAAPHEMGMRTVHVAPRAEQAPHIHHHTDDLTGFLGTLLA